MRNIEVIKEILKLINKERNSEFSEAASTLAAIRELVINERPQLNGKVNDKNQLKLEGVE